MRICLVKTSSLGDILHAFPVLAYLRHRFQDAQIDWMVERPYAELVRSHPSISSALVVDTKSWRKSPFAKSTWSAFSSMRKELRQNEYDLLFDLQGNLKSAILTAQVRCKMKVGPTFKSAAEWINPFFTHRHLPFKQGIDIRMQLLQMVQSYFQDETPFASSEVALRLTEKEQEEVVSLFSKSHLNQSGYRMFVAPGSIWKNKQLTTQQLVIVLKEVQQQMPVDFLFSWGSDAELADAVFLAKELDQPDAVLKKRYSLPQLAVMMQHVDLVACMDSLPLHLAAATTTTPTFAFFGPSSATVYNPTGSTHGFVQGSCPYGVNILPRCPKLRSCPTGACLRQTSETLLSDALLKHIQQVKR